MTAQRIGQWNKLLGQTRLAEAGRTSSLWPYLLVSGLFVGEKSVITVNASCVGKTVFYDHIPLSSAN